MKKFAIVFPVLAAALAMTPAAKADSYTYTISGSNFNATFYLTASANNANGVVTPGTDTITSVAGTFTVGGHTYDIDTAIAPVTAAIGSDDTHPTNNGEFLFDNLLYPSASKNKILDWDGLLIDVPGTNGYELNLFSGAFGGIPGNSAPGDMYFYFADNGSNHSNNPITPDSVNSSGSTSESLVATPEPDTLLLLGSGLLGLAFVVFRKGRPSRQVLNA